MSSIADKIIADLADQLRPTITDVEASIPVTKGHYGFYMGLISRYTDQRGQAVMFVRALVKAGANRQGTADALRQVYS